MNCSAWYSRVISSLLSYTMLSSCPSVAPLTTIGVRPLLRLDELFDEVRRLALHEDRLHVAAAPNMRAAPNVYSVVTGDDRSSANCTFSAGNVPATTPA